VAVGCDYFGDECGIPLVWHSLDGRTWKQARLPAAQLSADPARVTFAFGQYVTVGDECVQYFASMPGPIVMAAARPSATPCPEHMVSWSSADGQRWVHAAPAGVNGRFLSPEFFRAGDILEVVSDGHFGVSRDGLAWSPGPSVADGYLRQVVAQQDGFVGIGIDQQGLALWRSADGQTWQKLDDLPAFAGLFPSAAAATDSGLVVFASSDTEGTVALTSADATTWTQDPLPDPMSGMDVYDATVFNGELIATGNGQIAWHALPLP
jgi:hypothetical protein